VKPRFCDVPRPNKLAALPVLTALLLVAALAMFLAGVLGSAIAVSPAYAASPVSGLDPQAELSSSNAAAYDWFGNAVATSGDTALVGDTVKTVKGHTGAGAVYVFTRADGSWIQRAELTAPTPVTNGHFGQSVAIYGTTALVGVGEISGVAHAYVFTGSGSSWTKQAELVASDGAVNDLFGYSVALSGDTALVGAPKHNAAYVFTRSGTSWSQQAELTIAGGDFGWSVALAGDTALIGAYQHKDPWGIPNGAGYVFGRSGAIWNEQQVLTASDEDQYLGTSVALSADGCTALLGAPRTTVGSQVLAGAAYIFTRPDVGGMSWTEQTELTDADGIGGPMFGGSVALDGDTALIGDTHGPNASVFAGSGSSWTQQAELTDNATVETFGASVALDGGTALVGDPEQTAGSQKQGGAVYVYALDSTSSPVMSAAPMVSGAPMVSQTLSCSTGTWTGTPTPTITYQWLRSGQPINGATTATYVVQPADLGHQLACQVMATNSEGQAWANSNALSVPAPALSLKAASRAIRVGKTVTLSGSVKNALVACRTVAIYRKASGRLTLLKRLTISSSGTFKVAIKLKKTGTWVVLACYKVYGVTFNSNAATVRVRS
jgi:hypothetical protein